MAGATVTPAGITAAASLTSATVVITPFHSGNAGWWQLLSIAQDAAQAVRDEPQRRRQACPNDGEPYRTGPDGRLFCPFDGHTP